MAPNQLPPLRPNSNARRGSGDPRGPSGVTLVVTQQQQATENYEKRYLICLEHLKELWLRIYELEENDRQARAEHDGNLTLLKNRVREITREMEHLRPKIPQNSEGSFDNGLQILR
ncbi:hypothetical protein MY10362_004772 [Beauveria mimosiformis]